MTAPNHTCPKEYHKQSVPETPGSQEPYSSRLHWRTGGRPGVWELMRG